MKRLFKLQIIFVLMFIVSCNLTNLGDDDVFRKITVKKINSIKYNNSKVIFNISVSYPNGCGSFSHSEYEQRNQIINIYVYGKQKAGVTCTQEIITVKGDVTLNQPVSGYYKYSFW